MNIFIQLHKQDILINPTFLVKTLMQSNPLLISNALVTMIESDYNLIR